MFEILTIVFHEAEETKLGKKKQEQPNTKLLHSFVIVQFYP